MYPIDAIKVRPPPPGVGFLHPASPLVDYPA